MKKMIIVLSFLLPGTILLAQDKYHRAPEKVKETFSRDYPEAKKTHWYERNGEWQASFNDRDNGDMTAYYNRNGEHRESRIPYTKHDVPSPVLDRVNEKYPGAHDMEFTKIERHGEDNQYMVSVNHHGRHRTVYLDEQGQERKYNGHH